MDRIRSDTSERGRCEADTVARSNRQIMPIAGGYTGTPEDFIGMDAMVSVNRIN